MGKTTVWNSLFNLYLSVWRVGAVHVEGAHGWVLLGGRRGHFRGFSQHGRMCRLAQKNLMMQPGFFRKDSVGSPRMHEITA